jgi:hypothetical protein
MGSFSCSCDVNCSDTLGDADKLLGDADKLLGDADKRLTRKDAFYERMLFMKGCFL